VSEVFLVGVVKLTTHSIPHLIIQITNMQLLQRHATSTLLLVLASLSSFSEGFAIGPIRQGFLGSTVSDITESVNGEVYLETIMEDGFNVNQTESVVSIEKEEFISPTAPMAPPLTYRKFLTMQV
jgi:hypothetical protein